MKGFIRGTGVLLTLLGTVVSVAAQDDFADERSEPLKKESNPEAIKVKKHTAMGRFEPEMVVPPEDRVELKKERLAEIERTRTLLDTADISDRKRRRLMRKLYESPYSDRLEKFVETQYEDGDDPEYRP